MVIILVKIQFYRVSELKTSTLTENGVSSFLPAFKNFVKDSSSFNQKGNYPNSAKNMNEATFYEILYEFLCTDGKGFLGSIKLTQSFSCKNGNTPQYDATNPPKVLAMTFNYNHRNYDNAVDNIKSMNSVKDIVNGYTALGTNGKLFAHSGQYSDLVTMEIITTELIRNICLAVACIFLVTLLLLSDIVASLLVLGSVVLTLINVGGFMFFWGLSVDTVSSLLLTVSIPNLHLWSIS